MKTTIYWAVQHSCRAVHEFRFRAICWWLSRQVEFLEWRTCNTMVSEPVESMTTNTSVQIECTSTVPGVLIYHREP